jgi:hypothetical protein
MKADCKSVIRRFESDLGLSRLPSQTPDDSDSYDSIPLAGDTLARLPDSHTLTEQTGDPVVVEVMAARGQEASR